MSGPSVQPLKKLCGCGNALQRPADSCCVDCLRVRILDNLRHRGHDIEPPDADGEDFRGGETAAYATEQHEAERGLK